MSTQTDKPAVQEASQPPAEKPKSAFVQTKDLLSSGQFKAELAMALPRHLTVDRMLRCVLTSCRKNPVLLTTTRESFFSSILVCAQLGLEPDDPRQLASLVPFDRNIGTRENPQWVKECQVIIGYRGYIDLARRSGEVSNIQAEAVYEKDFFDHEKGLEPKLVHKPYLGDDDPGKLMRAYAICHYKDGSKAYVVLPRRKIEQARMVSKTGSKGYGPWKDWYDEMAQKTAVRRLAKFMPQSPELVLAQQVDEAEGLRVTRRGKEFDIDVAASVAALPETAEGEEQVAELGTRMDAKAAKVNGGTPKQTSLVDEKPAAD